MPTVKKSEISAILKKGGFVKYDMIQSKPTLHDIDGKKLGTINFSTYLNMDISKYSVTRGYLSEYYRLK